MAAAQQTTRLNNNWEFLKQDLGSIWETVRPLTKRRPGKLSYMGKGKIYRTALMPAML